MNIDKGIYNAVYDFNELNLLYVPHLPSGVILFLQSSILFLRFETFLVFACFYKK